MWKDANLLTEGNSAHSVKFTRYIPNLKSHKYSGTEIKANDNVSSIWHNGNKESAYFYVNAHQQGKRFALAKKTGDGDLGNSVGSAPAGYNDKISSAYSRSCLDNGCL